MSNDGRPSRGAPSDTAQEKPQQGKVIAAGSGGSDEAGKRIPIDVKVGDRILFGKWSGTEVKIDGVGYLTLGPPA